MEEEGTKVSAVAASRPLLASHIPKRQETVLEMNCEETAGRGHDRKWLETLQRWPCFLPHARERTRRLAPRCFCDQQRRWRILLVLFVSVAAVAIVVFSVEAARIGLPQLVMQGILSSSSYDALQLLAHPEIL